MFAELLGLVDSLSKVRDLKDLLLQERLKAMIDFLHTIGEVQIKTAIEELEAARRSSRPDAERDRAIGHLKVAANALRLSVDKMPLLRRVVGFTKKRKMRTYLQITGCYLLVAGLYRSQQNMELAQEYAGKASRAFQNYAEIRRGKLMTTLILLFTYNAGTDQAPLTGVVDNRRIRALMKHYGVQGSPDEDTLGELADGMVGEERERLFGWLGPLGELR